MMTVTDPFDVTVADTPYVVLNYCSLIIGVWLFLFTAYDRTPAFALPVRLLQRWWNCDCWVV